MTDSQPLATTDLRQYALARLRFDAGDIAPAVELASAIGNSSAAVAHAQELLGMAAARSGDAERALEHFRKAIALDAKVPSFHCNQGNALQDLGRIDRAISSYRRALRLFPGYLEAHNDLGTAYYQKGWLEESIACYLSALRINPAHGVAHGNLATAYRRLNRLRDARTHFYEELKCRVRDALSGAWLRWRSGRRGAVSSAPSAGDLLALALRLRDMGDAGMPAALCAEALRVSPGDREVTLLNLDLLMGKGAFEAALSLARAVEAGFQGDADFQQRLGFLHSKTGDDAGAEAAFRRALALRSNLPAALLGLGRLLLKRGKAAEAVLQLQEAVRADARLVDAWTNLGIAQAEMGHDTEAEDSLRRALELSPDNVEALKASGTLRHERNELADAERIYRRILALDHDNIPVCLRLGRVLQDQSRLDEAIDIWMEAIQIDPDNWRPYNFIAALYMHFPGERRARALHYLQEGLRRKPDSPAMLLNLVRLHAEEDNLAEALRHLQQAQAIAPADPGVLTMVGTFEMQDGQIEQAGVSFRRAIEVSPEFALAHNNLHHVLVEAGDLTAAWSEYEWRLQLDDFKRIHAQVRLPRWEGDAPRGQSLLIYPEQGIGDEMMFSTCMPQLLRDNPGCTLICSPKLEAMFRRSFPAATVQGVTVPDIPAHIASLEPQPRYKLALGSLPRFYRRSQADFSRDAACFKADPAKVERWSTRLRQLGPGLKVGISWQGGLPWTGVLRRSMALNDLLPILRFPDARFVSLQYTECKGELEALKTGHAIDVAHWQDAISDYDETAALVAALDVVVTVCTAVVHLAGGLGRPVLVMAPFRPTWRYLMGDGKMPWYADVKVIRQSTRGDWSPVISRVVAELEAKIAPET